MIFENNLSNFIYIYQINFDKLFIYLKKIKILF